MGRTDIFVVYGNQPEQMVASVMDSLDILGELPKDKPIGIKPNLVVSKPSDSGATTDPQIVAAVIQYLQSHGFSNLVIMESSWLGDDVETAFQVCGYEEISNKFGVPLLNMRKDSGVRIREGEMSIKVCTKATELGYLINIPVLKAHCQTDFTCALKNLKGIIPDLEKRRFHALDLHKPIAYLNKAVRTDLVIVDGIIGDLTHEEGGNPVQMNRIIAGVDPVLVDAYAATLIGYRPDEIDYITIADRIGVGTSDLSMATIHELNSAEGSGFEMAATNAAKAFARYIEQDKACSACYGSLVHALKRLSDKHMLHGDLEKISVGQGFKEQHGRGLGIGSCTGEFSCYLKGCPPNTEKIVRFIEEKWL
ncbi:MAG: DUF362 domain-containing protein [Proteobacteria bacterium]|nr:DUF362 domain-containing protein [Pseudomonadota bacterium]